MERGCVTVRERAKNAYRQRTVPLNSAARESMEWILERWKKIGGSDEEHYILPHSPRGQRAPHWRKKIPWIFYQPTTSTYSSFRNIRNAAGLPFFRIYDCRVQAITKLLSNPAVSPQVSREIAGHISQAMQNRYSIQYKESRPGCAGAPAPLQTPIQPKSSVIAFPGRGNRFTFCGTLSGHVSRKRSRARLGDRVETSSDAGLIV
jgi:hypothetical protein